jgi:predicted transcriptional regulator
VLMRTTVDLPDDIHRVAAAIARDSGSSLSETVTRLLRAALATPGPVRVTTSPRTGLRVASLGRVVTSDEVRSLQDDE